MKNHLPGWITSALLLACSSTEPSSGGLSVDASAYPDADASVEGQTDAPTERDAVQEELSDETSILSPLLAWPIDCEGGKTCAVTFPDIDGDGKAYDCGLPGYKGHQGTDISVTWAQMDQGVDVFAAQDGEVLWVFDGQFDRCPNAEESACQEPAVDMAPNARSGYMVCSEASDDYCVGTEYTRDCFWCFFGANVVVIRHPSNPVVFATRYDHLRKNSIVVKPGEKVHKGQRIAQVGSAGRSTGPHLHFEVWAHGFYDLADPWMGPCGPNQEATLWEHSPLKGGSDSLGLKNGETRQGMPSAVVRSLARPHRK